MAENGTENQQQNQQSNNQQTNAPANNSAEMPEWLKNPPSWYNASPPAQNQQQQQQQSNTGNARQDLTSVINALPDRIIDGIREAFPVSQQQNQQQNAPAATENQQSQQQAPSAEQRPGSSPNDGRSALAKWWFD